MIDAIVRRMGPTPHATPAGALFTADWRDVVFIHFEVDPRALQRAVPFDLDTRDGRAYVSLVAFTQRNLRPSVGGPVAAWLVSPLAHHAFLNLRTYVRVGSERGIHFLAEWIPNRLAVLVGPRTYGLPYRLGRLWYRADASAGSVAGRVAARGGALEYRGLHASSFSPADAGSLDHFLLERYVAFTARRDVRRRFAVDHIAWPQAKVDLHISDRSILALGGEWSSSARFIGANYSPGVDGVTIGAPTRIG